MTASSASVASEPIIFSPTGPAPGREAWRGTKHYLRGQLFLAEGNRARAKAELLLAAADSLSTHASVALADLYLEDQELAEAEALCLRTLAGSRASLHSSQMYYRLARARAQAGNVQGVVELLPHLKNTNFDFGEMEAEPAFSSVVRSLEYAAFLRGSVS